MRINAEQLRILVLLVLERYPSGVNADALLSAVYHAAVAELTDLPDVMERLAKENLIVFSDGKPDKVCVLTTLGHSVALELKNDVPENAFRAVVREYEGITEGMNYSSSVRTDETGAYFSCSAKEKGRILAEITLLFDDEKAAYTAKCNFDKRPDAILRAFGAVLSGNADFLLTP